MKAGQMRHRMRIEKPAVDAVDGFVGVVKPDWVPVAERDASIDPYTGREGFGADREIAGLTWRITMRALPDVPEVFEPNWRGIDVDTGAVYDFHEIVPTHDRAVLVLLASSGTAQP